MMGHTSKGISSFYCIFFEKNFAFSRPISFWNFFYLMKTGLNTSQHQHTTMDFLTFRWMCCCQKITGQGILWIHAIFIITQPWKTLLALIAKTSFVPTTNLAGENGTLFVDNICLYVYRHMKFSSILFAIAIVFTCLGDSVPILFSLGSLQF